MRYQQDKPPGRSLNLSTLLVFVTLFGAGVAQVQANEAIQVNRFSFFKLAQSPNTMAHPPLSYERLIAVLETRGYSSIELARLIGERKVDFKLDQERRRKLTVAGAYLQRAGLARLMDAVNRNYVAVPAYSSVETCGPTNPVPINVSLEELLKTGDQALYVIALPRLSEALRAYCGAIAIAPNDSRGYYGLGEIQFFRENYREAINQYKQAMRLSDEYKTHVKLCLAYIKIEDTKGTRDEYNLAMGMDPAAAKQQLSGVMLESPIIPARVTNFVNHVFADVKSLDLEKRVKAAAFATKVLQELTPGGKIDPGLTIAGVFHYLTQTIDRLSSTPSGLEQVYEALGLPPDGPPRATAVSPQAKP